MENEAIQYACSTTETKALVSIAISLKRIADAIEGSPETTGLVQGITLAIQDGIIAAKRMG